MTDYYSIDEILLEEEHIPVIFHKGVTGAGQALDPSSDEVDLAAGSKLEIPFWMTVVLVPNKHVSVRLPRFYGERIRRELQADASCVSLRECSQYYYELGGRLVPMVKDRTLSNFLLATFRSRYKEVLARCHNLSDLDMDRNKKILAKDEMTLVQAGYQSMNRFSNWLQRTDTTLQIASILARQRRKREPFESLNNNVSSSNKRHHASDTN